MTVYFIQRIKDNAVKVGYSGDVDFRIRTLRSEHGAIRVLGTMAGGEDVEHLIQLQFAEHCIEAGRTRRDMTSSDWFRPSPALLEFIAANAKPYREQRDIWIRFSIPMSTYNILRLVADEQGVSLANMLEDLVKAYADDLTARQTRHSNGKR